MHRVLTLTTILCLLTLTGAVLAQEPKPEAAEPGRYEIHVLTMGQGDALFARFGHIAMMVEDKKHSTLKVYNFGTFDFENPDLRIKYARGFLNYWVSIEDWPGTVMRYQFFNRDLFVHSLDLTDEQAAEVARRLDVNALPENREYAYRHYIDNCCTRIRDLLDDVLDGAISNNRNTEVADRTFRDWTREALEGLPFSQAVILYSLGPAIDRPITRWEEEFLPFVMAKDLHDTKIGPDQRPLVRKKRHVVKRAGAAVGIVAPAWETAVPVTLFVLLGIGLLLPLALGKRRIAIRLGGLGLFLWGLTAGLGGLMLVLYWTATTHFDTHYNENLLVNPVLHLWMVGPGIKLIFTARLKERTARYLGWYLVASMGLILFDMAMKIGPFIQNNWGVIAMAATCNLLCIGMLWRTGLVKSLRKPAS